jgi:excisionase family DNA binding protein
VDEAAAVARVSPKTIRQAIPTDLSASRPGRRRFLIRRRELDRWLEGKRVRAHDVSAAVRSILSHTQP